MYIILMSIGNACCICMCIILNVVYTILNVMIVCRLFFLRALMFATHVSIKSRK